MLEDMSDSFKIVLLGGGGKKGGGDRADREGL